MCHHKDKKDVNHKYYSLKIESHRSVTCARNRLEVGIAYALENSTAAYHQNRRNNELRKIRIIGVNTCYAQVQSMLAGL